MWALVIYWRDGVETVELFERERPAWREGMYQQEMGAARTFRLEFVG